MSLKEATWIFLFRQRARVFVNVGIHDVAVRYLLAELGPTNKLQVLLPKSENTCLFKLLPAIMGESLTDAIMAN